MIHLESCFIIISSDCVSSITIDTCFDTKFFHIRPYLCALNSIISHCGNNRFIKTLAVSTTRYNGRELPFIKICKMLCPIRFEFIGKKR